jgi:hypothetical protein
VSRRKNTRTMFGIVRSLWEQTKALKAEFAAWLLFRRIVFALSRCLRGFSKRPSPAAVIEVETALSPRQKSPLSMHCPFSNSQPPNQSLQPTGLLARG